MLISCCIRKEAKRKNKEKINKNDEETAKLINCITKEFSFHY